MIPGMFLLQIFSLRVHKFSVTFNIHCSVWKNIYNYMIIPCLSKCRIIYQLHMLILLTHIKLRSSLDGYKVLIMQVL